MRAVPPIERACGVCGQALFPSPLLVQSGMPASAQGLPGPDDLGQDQPVTLRIGQCSGCGLIQLDNDPVPYWREVIRAAGLSAEMRSFRLQQFSRWLRDSQLVGKRVLEVGCGRGEYLALLQECGAQAVGLEHAPAAVEHCRQQGLAALEGFIAQPTDTIAGGPYDGFVILNFLEHIPAAQNTLLGIANNLSPHAVGLVEVPNLDMILQRRLFAEFIADHVYYFTRQTLMSLLERSGFVVERCEPDWHGYVLSAVVRKREPLDVSALCTAEASLRDAFHRFIDRFPNRAVAVWGAGHQALALINLMSIAPRIRYVVDSAPFKQGRFTPASHVPIVAPDRLSADPVQAVIVLAASYTGEVVRQILQTHGPHLAIAYLAEGEFKEWG